MSLLLIRLNVSIIKSSVNKNVVVNLVVLRYIAIQCKKRNYKGEQETKIKDVALIIFLVCLVKHHFITIKTKSSGG